MQNAGVRVMMVTGDHLLTAQSIASKVGLETSNILLGREIETLNDKELQERLYDVSIFARTTPGHKLRIVRALQNNRER
ncbi:hypothetical protein J22TS1_42680 [Siminovitchia terrae]|uniref:hypothetical protein n=1 Tax=Siminovitchia terrae TaxID=1914933 RepID=UPI001B2DDEEA|nr:hypothetical protein J22TS1_42680 [Siminovitchia terrae]